MQRIRILSIAILLILLATGLGTRLVVLQGVEWREHALRASSMHRSIRYYPAPRGRILDSRGVVLASDTPMVRASFLLSELEPVRWVARRLSKKFDGVNSNFPWDEETLWNSIQGARGAIRDQFGWVEKIDHHPWLRNLDQVTGREIARAVRLRPEDYPGVIVVDEGQDYTIYIDPNLLFSGEIAVRRMERELQLDRGVLWAKVEQAYARVQDPEREIQEREWIFRHQRHPLQDDIPSQLVIKISTDPVSWPGIYLEEMRDRSHPGDPFLGQLLGHTGLPSQAVLNRWKQRDEPVIDRLVLRDIRVFEVLQEFSHHSADQVGRSGLESVLENRLRGKPGAEVRILDHLRRSVGAPLHVAQAQPGEDVALSLDIELSRWCQELLVSREVDFGAVVILDVDDGSAVGWTSLPAQGMEVYRDRELYRQRSLSKSGWFHDRVSGWAIDPGSTFKTVVALAALQAGVVTADEIIVCNGLLDPAQPNRNRCNNHPHGIEMNMSSALARSCNVYFYKMGQRLGIDGIVSMGEQLGLWRITGSGIASESAGIRPTTNPTGTGIGRGFTTTPLQMAAIALSIASRGDRPGIRVIDGIVGESIAPEIDQKHFETVIDGMVSAVRDRGGTAFNPAYGLTHYDVAVKTGTAKRGPSKLNDAWLIGFAPVVQPKFAFAISVQQVPLGGGEACAPILAEILGWLEQHRGWELSR
ncbi:MAG: penicillin-binding transpeptidase domain-containing protein [Planctomycetota bacterium]|nr:penicillin-binding transpeptidase domain-containing protein [Planctomycetota bacterium]